MKTVPKILLIVWSLLKHVIIFKLVTYISLMEKTFFEIVGEDVKNKW